MPLYTVNQLKTALGAGGGARTDKFTIEFGVPAGNGALTIGDVGPILCKAGTIPSKSIAEVEAWTQGRKLTLPGNTEFNEEWELTFYNTQDNALRKMFIGWMKSIDDFAPNKHVCDPASFMVEAKVMQLDCDGNPSATYTFFNMWPIRVESIDLDAENVNTIQQFRVAFKYSHWE